MDSLQPVLQPIKRVWRGLGRGQQIGLAAVAAALVGLLFIVSTVGRGADSAIAYSGLSNDDEAAIVQKLKDAKIPYELQDGGTIRVPSGQLQEARLATAGMGLGGKPAAGSGFELFNQPSFGQTEFTQKVNYQRALENELARSIGQMDAVDTARVHLVMPEQTLFANQQQPTTASVMLKLKPGKHLDSAQSRSISNMVAGSVQGLKPQNLTIVDINGNTLTPDDGAGSTAGLSSKQLETQRGYESTTEHNLQAMLDNVLGPGKATVRVAAVMNWDQIEQTNETYTPSDPTKTPVLTNHAITETSNGGAAVGGVPGAASNNGSAVPTYQGGTAGSGTTSKTDTETTYQLNKTVQKTVRAAGPVAPMRQNKPGTTVAQPIAEDPQKVYIREQIQLLGKSNPATVAQLIQTWMDEDRRN